MHIEELKQRVASFRTELKGASGPITIAIVDAMVAALGSLERRIAELETRLGVVHLDTFPSGLESKPMHDEAVALQQAKEEAAEKTRNAIEG